MEEIRASLRPLSGTALDEALKYCEDLPKTEDERSGVIESKAFTLVGITGIATAFITGFGALLLDQGKITQYPALFVFSAVYLLIVSSLVFTIYLALRVVTIGEYFFARPAPDDILDLPTLSVDDFKRERAASLFYSFKKNSRLVDRKGTYLGGAQLWFRNSMVVLLFLAFAIATYALANPLMAGKAAPPVQSSTQSTATATSSPPPSATRVTTPLPTPATGPTPTLSIQPYPGP